MTRKELLAALAQRGVHESCYSIGEIARDSESLSLVPEGRLWKIVYKERGECSDRQTGLPTEEAGCEAMYREFAEWFGWGE